MHTHTHTNPKCENSAKHLSFQELLKQQHVLPAVRAATEPLPLYFSRKYIYHLGFDMCL